MRKTTRTLISVFLLMSIILSLAACGGNKKADVITIYEGRTSEMRLIHQMVKLMVEEHTDAKVELLDEMSPVNSYNEIVKGRADMMNSYDGTVLTTFFHIDPADVTEGMSIYDYTNQEAAKKGLKMLDKLGLDNTYALGVPQELMDKYEFKTISDLIPIADELVFGAEHDFFTEEGSAKFNPLVAFYGLNFKQTRQVDLNLKYSAFENGGIDVMIVFTTDGLNRKAQLRALEDDKHFFPDYNGALLVRTDMFERLKNSAPNLEEVLNRLGGIFTNEMMVDLAYSIDVEGRDLNEVAKEFLQERNMIS